MRRLICVIITLTLFAIAGLAFGQQVRVKDLADIRGVRDNHLVGFGIVIGLAGSGDSAKSLATNRAVANMLTRLGMKTAESEVVGGNMAAVIVTADVPTFSRNGNKIDVRVSTVGDATSLAGGTLMMTPLRAGDGNVYASAQGAVVVGQASGQGVQVLTVARVPGGASIEREFAPAIAPNNIMVLSLKNPDFTTNARLTDIINEHFKGFYAKAKDKVSVEVTIPPLYREKIVEFVSELEALRVRADLKSVVVLNERTGTVVMGSGVVISPVTIAHGALTIQVGDAKDKKAKKQPNKNVVKLGGTTVGNLVKTMNALGVRPADLVGILQSVHASGALRADLKFL